MKQQDMRPISHKGMDAAMVPCNDNIKTHRHKDGGKMDGWREAERERERNLCQAMMTAVTLNR